MYFLPVIHEQISWMSGAFYLFLFPYGSSSHCLSLFLIIRPLAHSIRAFAGRLFECRKQFILYLMKMIIQANTDILFLWFHFEIARRRNPLQNSIKLWIIMWWKQPHRCDWEYDWTSIEPAKTHRNQFIEMIAMWTFCVSLILSISLIREWIFEIFMNYNTPVGKAPAHSPLMEMIIRFDALDITSDTQTQYFVCTCANWRARAPMR